MDEHIKALHLQMEEIDAEIYRLHKQRAALVTQDEKYNHYCNRHSSQYKGKPMSIMLYYTLSQELADLCDMNNRLRELEDLLCLW